MTRHAFIKYRTLGRTGRCLAEGLGVMHSMRLRMINPTHAIDGHIVNGRMMLIKARNLIAPLINQKMPPCLRL